MKTHRVSLGFTLVEMLASLLIVSLLTIVMMTGVNASIKAYQDLTFTSESDILASTVNTALSDLLRFAVYEGIDEDTSNILFSNENYMVNNGFIFFVDDKLLVEKGIPADEAPSGGTGGSLISAGYFALVNEGAYTSMKITDFKLSYDSGVFSGRYEIQDSAGTRIRTEEFAFRSLRAKRGD